ncbi:MAG: DUF1285 domain-containing protein [Rhodospirillales bacterium]
MKNLSQNAPLQQTVENPSDVPQSILQGPGPNGGRIRNICGDMDMRIDAEGRWYHEGSPIGRMELVRLFASVLRRDEAGDHWLVTPVEAARIRVEDAPFVVVEASREEGPDGVRVKLRNNLDEEAVLDGEHALRVETDPQTGEPRPYVHWRGGMEARLGRSVYYDLVSWGREVERDGALWLMIDSAGDSFPLGKLDEEAN